MYVVCNSCGNFVYVLITPSIKLLQLNLKNEVDIRKIYEAWRVHFMDSNQLAAAGFYLINLSNMVRCVFCGVEMGYWTDGDDALKEHRP